MLPLFNIKSIKTVKSFSKNKTIKSRLLIHFKMSYSLMSLALWFVCLSANVYFSHKQRRIPPRNWISPTYACKSNNNTNLKWVEEHLYEEHDKLQRVVYGGDGESEEDVVDAEHRHEKHGAACQAPGIIPGDTCSRSGKCRYFNLNLLLSVQGRLRSKLSLLILIALDRSFQMEYI